MMLGPRWLPTTSLTRAFCGALLLAGVASLAAPVAAAQTVRGTVIEDSTERPIAEAIITLLDASGKAVAAETRSSAKGSFTISAARFGTYRVRAVRIGYEPSTSGPIALTYGELATVRLVMSVAAAKLATVAVTERRNFTTRELMSTTGFEFRKARGVGSFFTRTDLDQMGLFGDIARSGRSGMLLRSTSIADERIVFMGVNCSPRLFLDGSPVIGGPINALQHINAIGLDNIHAVEVYRPSQKPPARLAGDLDGGCGFIAVWTDMQVFRDSVAGIAALRSGRARTGIQVIRGVALDFETERPVANVPVRLMSHSMDLYPETARSNAAGEFIIQTKRTGGMRLEIGNVGFATAFTPDFLLIAEELVQVQLLVSATRPVNAPMILVGHSLPEDFGSRDLDGFHYRAARRVSGAFIGLDELERSGASTLHDLVRGIEGVIVLGEGQTATITVRGRPSAPPCVPAYLIDGGRVRAGIADSTVRAMPLSTIQGVEVYRTGARGAGDVGGDRTAVRADWDLAEVRVARSAFAPCAIVPDKTPARWLSAVAESGPSQHGRETSGHPSRSMAYP